MKIWAAIALVGTAVGGAVLLASEPKGAPEPDKTIVGPVPPPPPEPLAPAPSPSKKKTLAQKMKDLGMTLRASSAEGTAGPYVGEGQSSWFADPIVTWDGWKAKRDTFAIVRVHLEGTVTAPPGADLFVPPEMFVTRCFQVTEDFKVPLAESWDHRFSDVRVACKAGQPMPYEPWLMTGQVGMPPYVGLLSGPSSSMGQGVGVVEPYITWPPYETKLTFKPMLLDLVEEAS